MNLKTFLFFSALLLVWILLSHVYMLLYYWGALMITVSFLNTRQAYKLQPYKWINLSFFLYILFIVWERTRHYKFNEPAELIINDAEHILFALIISLLIYLVFTLSTRRKYAYTTAIIITCIIFNAVGVVNECFQNILAQRPVFIFIPDSQKDMLMNVFGTIVFIALAILIRQRGIKRLAGAG